uniref:semaphorin-5A-like n=1 Tax=Myxine glutinosa TaxID=7769 RepID=UPI00358F01F4
MPGCEAPPPFSPVYVAHPIAMVIEHFLLLLFPLLRSVVDADPEENEGECKHKKHPQRSYEELKPYLHAFTFPGAQNFSDLVFDPMNGQLVVGARNYLFQLSLADLSLIQVTEWGCDRATQESCYIKGKSEVDCHNYIRVLLLRENHVFACGTNAFTPVCTTRQRQNVSVELKRINGVARCPYDPSQSLAALSTERGEVYVATAIDFAGRDPAIYRSLGGSPSLRTAQYNSRWLNEPTFVSAFESGPFIFFLFHETAMELQACGDGTGVASRIARLCRNDVGGHFLLEDTWTTFSKARLVCRAPGSNSHGFSELRAAVFLPSSGLLYGLFTGGRGDLRSSAICIYSMSSISQAFAGDFLTQDASRGPWLHSPNPNPTFQCGTVTEGPNTKLTELSLVDAQRLLLKEETIQPLFDPLVMELGQSLSHLAVDVLRSSGGETLHVIFTATDSGSVLKVLTWPDTVRRPCLIEELQIVAMGESGDIQGLRLAPDGTALLVLLPNGVTRLPLARCPMHTTHSACLQARDPYCGWDSALRLCTAWQDGTAITGGHWEQDLSACPVQNLTRDGSLGPWGSWSLCDQAAGDATGSCKCRQRSCNNPKPRCGGRPCNGNTVQVSNCSRDGGWTPWSLWSSCSTSCAIGFRVRQRSCSNPTPRHGGRVCVGQNREERFCNERAHCPLPVSWAPWSAWGGCSAPCGGGTRLRHRTCHNGDGPDGAPCPGCNTEHQQCNMDPCPEVRKTTPWSPWFRVNGSDFGTEKRHRYTCRARVPNERGLELIRRKTETRVCSDGAAHCATEAPADEASQRRVVDGTWGSWSRWGECSRDCGRGFRSRHRFCDSPAPLAGGLICSGSPTEYQECNRQPCPVHGGWTCWSTWTSCSASCAGGHHQRRRSCTQPLPSHGGDTCLGLHTEDALCNTQPCSDGWSAWSDWAPCDGNGMRSQSRRCLAPFPPSLRCRGNSTQSQPCPSHLNAVEIRMAYAAIKDKRCADYTLVHMILTGLGCGVAGCLVTLLLLFALSHCGRKTKCQTNNPSNTSLPPAPLNTSMSPHMGNKLEKFDSLEAIKVLNKNCLMNDEKSKYTNSQAQHTRTFANTIYSGINTYEPY